MTHNQPLTIMCDFDGTISPTCLCDFLYEKFAACGVQYSELWAQGMIGTREEIETTFQYISASRAEMEKALATVAMVPGFREFYDHCRTNGTELVVVSDGLEWAIRYMLSRVGVEDIQVMANQIFFENGGYRFNFPYFDPAAPKAGVYKKAIADQIKQGGGRVYLIGDGRTDFEAARAADFVFARDALWDYCQQHQLPARRYEDFFDILDYFQKSG